MTVEQLQNAMRATPFRPFSIRMADGRVFHIPHPDFLSKSPTGRTVIVYGDNDSFSIIDMLLATELEFGPMASAKT